MLKGAGENGTERRPEKVVEFTDAWLKTLPEPTSYADVFWDTVCPRLTVIKAKRGVLFRVKLRKGERRALGITSNAHLTTLGYDMPVETAREKYRELLKAAEEGRALYGTETTAEMEKLMRPAKPRTDRSYETLMSVLMDAYAQASSGKGLHRHSDGQPFEEQDMQRIIEATSIDFALGQAIKKMLEARRGEIRLPTKRAELLGAIVYIAGAIVAIDKQISSSKEDKREAAMQELATLGQQIEKGAASGD